MAKRSKKRAPDLRSLSRQRPTHEEESALIDAMFAGSPLVSAVLAQGVLENELEILLRTEFKRRDDTTWAMVTGEYGPLGTFNAKIIAAYAFGLIDDITRKNLNVIRDIRNAFAHTKRLLDFENASVRETLAQAAVPTATKTRRAKRLKTIKSLKDGRYAFLVLADQTGADIAKRTTERFKRRSKYAQKKLSALFAKRESMLRNALLSNPKVYSKSAPPNQTSDPKVPMLSGGLLGALAVAPLKSEKGK